MSYYLAGDRNYDAVITGPKEKRPPHKKLVMLASKYEERRVTYPCYVQPKLDGIRAYYKKGNLYSRDRKLLKVTAHITQQISRLQLPDDVILDGELYKHGWPLQRINSAIGVNRETPTKDTLEVDFCIFDVINPNGTYKTRWTYFADFILPKLYELKHVMYLVPTLVLNKADADVLYARFLGQGFEGMIYRVGDCLYRPGMRSLELLKRKDWLDVWCKVTKLYEGKTTELGSKFRNTLGGVSCQMGDKQFDVGSGFTNVERNDIWDKKRFIHRVHVRYEKLSEDGIPLKPTVIEWD